MKDFKFYLDQQGVQEVIYHSTKLSETERQIYERALSQATASFLQEFGTEGKFVVEFKRAKVSHIKAQAGATRPTYRIKAADAKTGAILKAHPGWLARFNQNAKL